MLKKKNILRLFYIFCAVYFSFFYCGSAYGLDPVTKQRIKQGIGYYDPACDPTASSTDASPEENDEIKNVYMRGDSITLGAIVSGIENDFKNDGISATVTGSGGGTVARGGGTQTSPKGDQLSGLDAIQKDKNKVRSADAVVVAYGTNNLPSEMSAEIKEMVKKIKSINKDVQIFWVNTDTHAAENPVASSADSKDKNNTIEEQSQKLDFSVIDVTKDNIPLADDIHPSVPNGYKKWISAVIGGVTSGPTNSSQKNLGTTTGIPCCPNSGSTSLDGSNNEEKVWNYFISKGLPEEAVAGIMGNIARESGFDPMITEMGHGFPERSKDPSVVGSYGWGLIGFTPGTSVYTTWAKTAKVDANPDNVYLLETQLDIIYGYMKNVPPVDFDGDSILDALTSHGKDVKTATTIFEMEVENAGVIAMEDRIAAAEAALDKYGGTAPSGGGGSVGENCECNSASSVSGNLSKALEEMADKNGGKTQISVSSVNGDTTADSGGEVQMPTRSSYKIYTAYATLRAIENGKITWSSRTSWGQSVEATMEAMIIRSDNDAAEALRLDNRIGSPKEVTKMLQDEVGLSNKTIMGSGNANDPAGSNSQSTANDFTKFLILLERHRLPKVKKESDYNRLIGFMKKATTDGASARAGIVAGVGKGVEVADKPGWASGSVDPASNDVGIVYLKGNPYVISILTDKPNQWDGVAKIAEQVHSLMGGSQGSNCGESSGDLSSIITSYAWPEYSSSRSDPKPEYKTAYDKAVSKGQYGGGGYTDCGAFVTRVMIDSGFEPKYNSSGKGGNTLVQMDWLNANWDKINVSSTKDLELGDVAISTNHTYMYVGKIPDFGGDSASASLGSRVPMASSYYSGFEWYRKK